MESRLRIRCGPDSTGYNFHSRQNKSPRRPIRDNVHAGQRSRKHKSTVCPTGLLFLVLLRLAHTRRPRSRARKLSIGLWETNYWSKTIVNLNNAPAPENRVFSPYCPEEGVQTAAESMFRIESNAFSALPSCLRQSMPGGYLSHCVRIHCCTHLCFALTKPRTAFRAVYPW